MQVTEQRLANNRNETDEYVAKTIIVTTIPRVEQGFTFSFSNNIFVISQPILFFRYRRVSLYRCQIFFNDVITQ